MKNISIQWLIKFIIILTLIIATSMLARTREIEKTFPVKSAQRIILSRDFGFSSVTVKSWDKSEVYVKIRVKFTSSDHEYEKGVIDSYDIIGSGDDKQFTLSTKRIGNESSYSSFLGIKFRIAFYESTDLEGEIFVPKDNPLKSTCSYSNILLENMKNEIELYGTSNTIEIYNSGLIKAIENNYGKTKVENCSGNLYVKSISGKININNLSGQLTIDGNYSDITLNGIKQTTVIRALSGKHSINNIDGDLFVKSNYSTIYIEDVNGLADIVDLSGTVSIKKAGGAKVDGRYCKIFLSSITGKSGREINVKSTSGKLVIDDATGSLVIDNPYSDIALKNIRGDITISGNSSNVYAEKINGNWNSNTHYTKVIAHDLSAKNIKIVNLSDLVELDLETIPSEVDIKNQYGNVSVTIPQGYAGEVDLGVSYGKIISNLPLKIKELAGASIASGRIGAGHGKINIENKSSDITLNQKFQ